jgi:hypothetical protein
MAGSTAAPAAAARTVLPMFLRCMILLLLRHWFQYGPFRM